MAAANKTRYIVFDRYTNEWTQMESLDPLKADLTEKFHEWGGDGDEMTSENMELTIIKVPPNSKASEITLKMKVEHKWEVNS